MARCITAKELVDAKESIIQEVIASIGSTSSFAAKDSPCPRESGKFNSK